MVFVCYFYCLTKYLGALPATETCKQKKEKNCKQRSYCSDYQTFKKSEYKI